MPRRLPSFVPSHSAPLMPISSSGKSKLFTPEKVGLTVNSKKETNAKGQNGPRVKMGYSCLPPESIKLTVNSKKETNGTVKMGQGSRRTTVVY